MKKIGIITFHNTRNYGASLQMFALFKYLCRQGYEVEVIDYISNVSKHYSILFPKFRKNVVAYLKQLKNNLSHHKEMVYKKNLFDNFNKRYIRITERKYRNTADLKRMPPEEDIYITGSDQVWNTSLTGKVDDGYLLNFGEKEIKRVSYAASIGSDELDAKYKEQMISLISNLDAISVRESSAKTELDKYIDKPISVVTDPVFLMTSKQWKEELALTDKCNEKYIFVYLVVSSQEVVDIVNKISEQTGYPIYCNKKDDRYKNVGCIMQDVDPRKFVELIKNAEYIISNSFHATAFSIIFQRKFFVVPHKTLNARISDLLEMVGLEARQIVKPDDLEGLDWRKEIDYSTCAANLEDAIQQSKEYLKRVIA